MKTHTGHKNILIVAAILVVFLAILAGVFDKAHATYAATFLVPVLLAFAFLEHISEFKAGKSGFEAKTRNLISEAESAVVGVHSLALSNAKISLDLLSNRMGWHEHYPPEEVERLKEETITVLTDMGIPLEKIKSEALSGWYRNVISFYRGNLTSHWTAARDEVQSEMKKLNKLSDEDLVEALRKAYARLGIEDRAEIVNDFEYLIKNKEHRRPDKWLDVRKMSLLK